MATALSTLQQASPATTSAEANILCSWFGVSHHIHIVHSHKATSSYAEGAHLNRPKHSPIPIDGKSRLI
jgi:hypothetical protein